MKPRRVCTPGREWCSRPVNTRSPYLREADPQRSLSDPNLPPEELTDPPGSVAAFPSSLLMPRSLWSLNKTSACFTFHATSFHSDILQNITSEQKYPDWWHCFQHDCVSLKGPGRGAGTPSPPCRVAVLPGPVQWEHTVQLPGPSVCYHFILQAFTSEMRGGAHGAVRPGSGPQPAARTGNYSPKSNIQPSSHLTGLEQLLLCSISLIKS